MDAGYQVFFQAIFYSGYAEVALCADSLAILVRFIFCFLRYLGVCFKVMAISVNYPGMIRTGHNAVTTANTFLIIDVYNPICSLIRCTCGTNALAWWIVAMHTAPRSKEPLSVRWLRLFNIIKFSPQSFRDPVCLAASEHARLATNAPGQIDNHTPACH